MLKPLFDNLKKALPPKTSFQLRSLKSKVLDREMHALSFMAKSLGGRGKYAIDVGANSGIYAGEMAKYFEGVIALEPQPSCAEYMRAVLPDNCRVIEVAASDVLGRTTLRVPVANGAAETTRATISQENQLVGYAQPDMVEIDVETIPLDIMMKNGQIEADSVTMLKVDVEGHEFAVLRGAEEFLGAVQPGLYLELEERHGTQTLEILRFLGKLGYRVARRQGEAYVVDEMFDENGTPRKAGEYSTPNYTMLTMKTISKFS